MQENTKGKVKVPEHDGSDVDRDESDTSQVESSSQQESETVIPSHDLRGIVYQDLGQLLVNLNGFIEGRLNDISKNTFHENQTEKVQSLTDLQGKISLKLRSPNIANSDINEILIATENAMKMDRDNYQKYGKFINRLFKFLGINRTTNSSKMFHNAYGFRQEGTKKIEITRDISNEQLKTSFKNRGKEITSIERLSFVIDGRKVTNDIPQEVTNGAFSKSHTLKITYQHTNSRKSFTSR